MKLFYEIATKALIISCCGYGVISFIEDIFTFITKN